MDVVFLLCERWIFVGWMIVLVVWTLDYGCVDDGFWLCGRWVWLCGRWNLVWTLNFGWVYARFWLCGRWILVVLTLDFGWIDVGFWLY